MFLHSPSGLYLTMYRAYDPYSGRWLSRDLAGETGDTNLYAYVGNDPANRIDPDGRFFFLITGAVGAVGGAAGDIIHQLYSNGWNFGQINRSEVETAAAFGGAAGLAAPFVATSYIGAVALGAGVNTAQYLFANGFNSTFGGAAFAAVTGAAGGLIGGPIENPFMFINKINPFSGSLTAAAANTGLSSFVRNAAGSAVSGVSASPNAANGVGSCQ